MVGISKENYFENISMTSGVQEIFVAEYRAFLPFYIRVYLFLSFFFFFSLSLLSSFSPPIVCLINKNTDTIKEHTSFKNSIFVIYNTKHIEYFIERMGLRSPFLHLSVSFSENLLLWKTFKTIPTFLSYLG